MQDITIDAVFQTKTRTHISSALSGMYDPKRGMTYRYGRKGTGLFPLTLTKTVPVMLPLNGVLASYPIPVLPATTLRGMLRRQAAGLIQQVLLSKNLKISHDVYQAMHCGAVRRAPSGDLPEWEKMVQIMDHIFFGVYGGGARMTPSRLRVRDAYPCLDILAEHHIIPKPDNETWLVPVKGPDALRDLLVVDQTVRRDDLLLGTDPMAPEIIAHYAEAYAQLVGDTLTRRKTRTSETETEEEDDPTDRATVSTLVFFEYIPPGTPFCARFHLRRPTEAQAGFLIRTLMAFVEHGQIGAKKALGMGEFACLAAHVRTDGATFPIMQLVDGKPMWTPSGVLAACLDEADRALDALDPENLEQVIR
jgi:CRISPR type IV-associated protein Csf2